jgi:hypothetical protein
MPPHLDRWRMIIARWRSLRQPTHPEKPSVEALGTSFATKQEMPAKMLAGKVNPARAFAEGPQPWRQKVWERSDIPSMICADEIDFLHYLAQTEYRGEGVIVEFGPLGGASTWALASGAPEATLHAYDLWIYFDNLRDYFLGKRLRRGQNVLPIFEDNIRPFRDRVRAHRGDLRRQRWHGAPIEIVFVDAAKTPECLLHMFREFFPCVVRGGWIVWQDYVSSTCPWIHIALEELGDYFEYWDSPEGGTVVTRLKRTLPRQALSQSYFSRLPIERARALIQKARDRCPGWEALDVWLSEALWVALANNPSEVRKIVEAVQLDPRFPQGSFDYDLNFVKYWVKATTAGRRFKAF